jgi:predicted HAD superfamily Cof-like phosphohydrolase
MTQPATNSIDHAVSHVTDFHNVIGSPIASEPRLLPHDAVVVSEALMQLLQLLGQLDSARRDEDELTLRLCLELEEITEWLDAHLKNDLIAAADAWGDRLYVLLGDAVSGGLPAQSIFDEVHHSNMSKQCKSTKRGKAVKGRAYQRPQLDEVITQHKQS